MLTLRIVSAMYATIITVIYTFIRISADYYDSRVRGWIRFHCCKSSLIRRRANRIRWRHASDASHYMRVIVRRLFTSSYDYGLLQPQECGWIQFYQRCKFSLALFGDEVNRIHRWLLILCAVVFLRVVAKDQHVRIRTPSRSQWITRCVGGWVHFRRDFSSGRLNHLEVDVGTFFF